MAGNDPEKDAKQRLSLATNFAIYGASGVQLAVSTVAGLVFGDYIDKKLGVGPWCAMAGAALGFIAGIVTLIRILKKFGK